MPRSYIKTSRLLFVSTNTRLLVCNAKATYRPTYALKGRKVTVCENEEGKIYVLLGKTPLEFKRFYKQPKRQEVASAKEIERLTYKPAEDHPWRNYGHRINGKPIRVPD